MIHTTGKWEEILALSLEVRMLTSAKALLDMKLESCTFFAQPEKTSQPESQVHTYSAGV